MILKLACKPFVADYLRNKLGPTIRITSKNREMEALRALMETKTYATREQTFVDRYGAYLEIEFPRLYVFRQGKVGIPSTAVMAFNTLIRDHIAEGMNDWIDTVKHIVNRDERELIIGYLLEKGISMDNINIETWQKVRTRFKQGPKSKEKSRKKPVGIVHGFKEMSTHV